MFTIESKKKEKEVFFLLLYLRGLFFDKFVLTIANVIFMEISFKYVYMFI